MARQAVEMHLRDDHVRSGGDVYITYEQVAGEPGTASLSPAASLNQDGKTLYRLFVRDASTRAPAYAQADDKATETSNAISTGGPYRFQLPPVPSGAYELCATYALPAEGDEAGSGEACERIEIE